MSEWFTAGVFVLLVAVVAIYRHDAARAAVRHAEQNAHWSLGQTKVLEMLAATEQLLREQQNANKILESQNARLARRIAAIQAELKEVTAELKAVRVELASMTKRAISAEGDKAD